MTVDLPDPLSPTRADDLPAKVGEEGRRQDGRWQGLAAKARFLPAPTASALPTCREGKVEAAEHGALRAGGVGKVHICQLQIAMADLGGRQSGFGQHKGAVCGGAIGDNLGRWALDHTKQASGCHAALLEGG